MDSLHVILHPLSSAENSCLQTNGEDGLPFFQGYAGDAGRPDRRIQHQHQAIIPSYKFNCCGNITEWGVDLNPAEENVTFNFEFQVWRPSPTVSGTGCYSLVNNFIVRSTSIPTQPESEHVARVTPSPQDRLEFQPGDVLGFYVESNGTLSDDDNGVVLLNNGSHTSELVWFASIDITAQPSQSGSCPYPVGINGVLNSLTHAAPVISVGITTYSCSNSAQLQPTTFPKPEDELSLSSAMVAGIAVPLALFGIINAVMIAIVIVLYCKIRKLHKVVLSISAERRYRPNEEPILTQREEAYDRPEMHSIHLVKNVAYSTSNVHIEQGNNYRM